VKVAHGHNTAEWSRDGEVRLCLRKAAQGITRCAYVVFGGCDSSFVGGNCLFRNDHPESEGEKSFERKPRHRDNVDFTANQAFVSLSEVLTFCPSIQTHH